MKAKTGHSLRLQSIAKLPVRLRSLRLARSRSGGYTIVEVLIFLAVTSALLVIAFRTFSGQQARTEFNTGIRDVNSKIQDIINNVSTGYYTNSGKIKCYIHPSGKVRFDEVTTGQGSNAPCIYIGQVLHFAPRGKPSQINIYSAAGRRVDSSGNEITSVADAEALLIAQGTSHNNTGPDTTEFFTVPYGLKIIKVSYNETGAWEDIGSAGIFTSFNQAGSSLADVIVFKSPGASFGLDTQQKQMVNEFDNRLDVPAQVVPNPKNGVKICIKSDATNQVGVITIAATTFTSTTLDIYRDSSEANTAVGGTVC